MSKRILSRLCFFDSGILRRFKFLKKSGAKTFFAFAVSSFLLLLFFLTALLSGSTKINFSNIIKILLDNYGSDETDVLNALIVLNIRLPRILLAMLAGACLSVSGVLFQAVMQNPLADPGIIGVSSGAKLGSLVVLMIFPNLILFVPVFAFLSGMAAAFTVYALAWRGGVKTSHLILAGVAVNSILNGVISLFYTMNSDKLQSIIIWANGSLAGKSWKDVYGILPYAVTGLFFSLFMIRYSNILLLGEEKAGNLGININKSRILISASAAFLAAAAVSVVGVIGFIGLVVPHISRLIAGSNYKKLLPYSMLNGALLLLAADTCARTILSPIELPVGILTAILGGPFFIRLLRKNN